MIGACRMRWSTFIAILCVSGCAKAEPTLVLTNAKLIDGKG